MAGRRGREANFRVVQNLRRGNDGGYLPVSEIVEPARRHHQLHPMLGSALSACSFPGNFTSALTVVSHARHSRECAARFTFRVKPVLPTISTRGSTQPSALCVTAGPGSVVVVPTRWTHATNRADPNQPLTFDVQGVRDFGFDCRDVRSHGGPTVSSACALACPFDARTSMTPSL